MNPTRRTLLSGIGAGAVLSVAGCAGDGDGNGDDDTETTTEPTTTEAETTTGVESTTPSPTTTGDGTTTPTDSGGDADVRVATHSEHGDVLVGPEGFVLYMFDSDERGAGASACYDSCADNWPPLTVESGPAGGPDVTAELETFERDDGARQVVAGGWPLYYYAADGAAGEATGQGVGDIWWVIRPDGTPIRPSETATETEMATSTTADDAGGGY